MEEKSRGRSRRIHHDVTIEVDSHGPIIGDMAYGGNWFFIADAPLKVTTENIRALTDLSIAIREACFRDGISGPQGQPVDHVILSGTSPNAFALRRNFVLCPDDDYDRSPCGTGSSAFVSCLAASGALAIGEQVVIESVIGSSYSLSYRPGPTGGVIPGITGQAHVMADTVLRFDPHDPFRNGIA